MSNNIPTTPSPLLVNLLGNLFLRLLADRPVSFPLMMVTSSMTLPLRVLASLDWVTVYLKL